MTTGYRGPVEQPEQDRTTEHSGPSHYFSPQASSRSKRSTVHLDLPDLSLDLITDRGVFSPDRVDPGTKLLLLEIPELGDGAVLDLGCGYGPIASVLVARRPGQQVWAVDVNERALALCAENLTNHAHSASDFTVATPEDVPDDLEFTAIVSNPPIRVGKKVLHSMLRKWLDRLAPDGEAWLVVHRHLGADSLSEWMTGNGFVIERIRSRQGYRILRVTRSGA
ncbi:MAG: methyltransferase [Microthrixaceae bacterium]|nr:methyltransferase [Microthrixaceae bacterium]